MMMQERKKPDWAKRAEHIPHKPNWVETIPNLLCELGDVFFPIPRGRKGWGYPHHMDEFRFSPESEKLNAYFEQGWGYGIACANDLAVVDIDEKEFVQQLADELKPTAYQWTGSREGTHFLYRCPGLNERQILHYKDGPHDCVMDDHDCEFDENGDCVKEYEWEHLGEVKCDPHGYVVGPGSVHPSGNKYGPLKGKEIATIEKEELLEILDDYIKPNHGPSRADVMKPEGFDDDPPSSEYDFYNIGCEDVIPWLEPGVRVPHPVHGSSTGTNFMRTEDGDAFMCWRHDYGGSQGCGLSPQQLLAVKETKMDCDNVRRRWKNDPTLHWAAWKKAVKDEIVSYRNVPYTVVKGYGIKTDVLDKDDDLGGGVYWDLFNSIKIEMEREHLPDEPQ